MKLAKWLRFEWDLNAPALATELVLEDHYTIRPAQKGELMAVRTLVITAFSQDNDWSDVASDLKPMLETAVERTQDQKDISTLLLLHGNRAVGASILSHQSDIRSNLLSGPVLFSEYRNRGWGTRLLEASLIHLRETGIGRAFGVTKLNSTAAKFVYPKFGSVSAAFQYEPAEDA